MNKRMMYELASSMPRPQAEILARILLDIAPRRKREVLENHDSTYTIRWNLTMVELATISTVFRKELQTL